MVVGWQLLLCLRVACGWWVGHTEASPPFRGVVLSVGVAKKEGSLVSSVW